MRHCLLILALLVSGCQQDQAISVDTEAIILQSQVSAARELCKTHLQFDYHPDLPESQARRQAAHALLKELPSIERTADFVIADKGKTPQFREQLAAKAALLEKLKTDLENANRAYYAKSDQLYAEAKAQRQKAGHDLGVTMDAYNRIRDGMSMFEIYQIVGEYGTEVSRAGSLATYIWSDGFKSITCTTDGEQVVAKAQLGL